MSTTDALERARALARRGDDEGAKLAYVEVLREDPADFHALNELGTLALAGGYRSAARTAYGQAVQHHPGNPVGRVNFANVLARGWRPCGRAASLRGRTRRRSRFARGASRHGLGAERARPRRCRGASAARVLRARPGDPALSRHRQRGAAAAARVGARRQHPDQAVDRRSALHAPRALSRILRPGRALAAACAGRERRGRCGSLRRSRSNAPRRCSRAAARRSSMRLRAYA